MVGLLLLLLLLLQLRGCRDVGLLRRLHYRLRHDHSLLLRVQGCVVVEGDREVDAILEEVLDQRLDYCVAAVRLQLWRRVRRLCEQLPENGYERLCGARVR